MSRGSGRWTRACLIVFGETEDGQGFPARRLRRTPDRCGRGLRPGSPPAS
ncbi:MAG: hypothetical protein MZW92_45790 [Comamonadaceae bacterium]|nr:hypothetical protein [Comamonadaceae bacterium]